METKKKIILEAVEKKLKSININQRLKYEENIGPGLLKKIKRFLFAPNIVIKQKLKKFFGGKNLDFKEQFQENFELILNLVNNLDDIWELKTIKFLINNFSPNEIFYDFGAGEGLYTSLALEFCKEIHSFEPLPECFIILKRRFGKYPNVFLNNVAVSNKEGIAKLNKSFATLVDEVKSLYKKEGTEIEIQTTTLDNYLKTHRKPTLIKMDVEGAEFLILEGGLQFFKNNSPIIVMEVLGDEFISNSLKAVNLLKKLGYKAFEIEISGEIREISYDKFNFAKGVNNYAFLK